MIIIIGSLLHLFFIHFHSYVDHAHFLFEKLFFFHNNITPFRIKMCFSISGYFQRFIRITDIKVTLESFVFYHSKCVNHFHTSPVPVDSPSAVRLLLVCLAAVSASFAHLLLFVCMCCVSVCV